uniref:Uncharacterized protein n=1 Tax=Rhizophora mucronata TaxID=61149 RepID=A0A2P2NUV4_RHIMU
MLFYYDMEVKGSSQRSNLFVKTKVRLSNPPKTHSLGALYTRIPFQFKE